MRGGRFGPDRFFKHGQRPGTPFFEKGGIKFAILDLLKDRPRHGYDIILEMERRSGGLYSPSPGAVYPTLQALEDQDLVTSNVEEGKKTYTITEAGLAYLEEHQERVRRHRERWVGQWGEWGAPGPEGEGPSARSEIKELLVRLTREVWSAATGPEKEEEVSRVLEETLQKITAIGRGRPSGR